MKMTLWIAAVLAAAGLGAVQAAEVSGDEAACTAQGFVICAGGTTLDGAVNGHAVRERIPVTADCNGREVTLAYAVNFTDGGWAIVTADDRMEPILAFSSKGSLSANQFTEAGSALRYFVTERLKATYQALASEASTGSAGGATLLAAAPVSEKTAAAQARRLRYALAAPGRRSGAQLMSVEPPDGVADLRVGELLQTKWYQRNHGENHYATNIFENTPCGCNQTALGQIMYYHKWPQDGIGVIQNKASYKYNGTTYTGVLYDVTAGAPLTQDIYMMIGGKPYVTKMPLYTEPVKSNDVAVTAAALTTTRGGDGAGGPYRWDLMYVNSGEPTLEQREALGALTWDIGMICGANYRESTGALPYPTALTTIFKYANFRSTGISTLTDAGPNHTLLGGDETTLANAVRANCDAGYPCEIAGYADDSSGHAVIMDGYGFQDGKCYYHVNFGWGGVGDGFYDWDSWYGYSAVYVYFNIFPDRTGEIVSGRVLRPDGTPLANAEVTVVATNGTTVGTVRTNAQGVWGCAGVPASQRVEIRAAAAGYEFAATNVVVGYSNNVSTCPKVASCGNVWGIELTGTAVAVEGVTLTDAETQAGAVTVPYAWLTEKGYDCSTPEKAKTAAMQVGANGYPVWASYVADLVPTDPDSKLLATIAIRADGQVTVDYTPKSAARTYRVLGKAKLTDAAWSDKAAEHRFFKVSVALP